MGLRRNKKLKTRLAGSEPVRVAVQAPGACPRAVREKGRGFSPSPPSATIQHAPQGRRTLTILGSLRGLKVYSLIRGMLGNLGEGILDICIGNQRLHPKP